MPNIIWNWWIVNTVSWELCPWAVRTTCASITYKRIQFSSADSLAGGPGKLIMTNSACFECWRMELLSLTAVCMRISLPSALSTSNTLTISTQFVNHVWGQTQISMFSWEYKTYTFRERVNEICCWSQTFSTFLLVYLSISRHILKIRKKVISFKHTRKCSP